MFYLLKFLEDESGATAIEYGLLAVLIGVALTSAFTLLGQQMFALFDFMVQQVSPILQGAGG